MIRTGGYLGAFSLTGEMPEVQRAREAIGHVLARTPERPSIVLTSVLSALDGCFGDVHSTQRTWGTELFINPLMSLYWCFRLGPVARRIVYLPGETEVEGYLEFQAHIDRARAALGRPLKPWRDLPM